MNIVDNPGDAVVESGKIDVTTGRKFDRDLTEMTISEVIDLGKRRSKHYEKRGGAAAGKYQFIPLTLESYAKKTFGSNWGNEKFSAQNQEKLMDKFEEERNAAFRKMGIPLTNETAYLYHLSSDPGRVKKMIEAPENTLVGSFFDESARTQNPWMRTKTIGQYRRELNQRNTGKTESITDDLSGKINGILQRLYQQNEELKKAYEDSMGATLLDLSTNINTIIQRNDVTIIDDDDDDERTPPVLGRQ